MAEHTQGRLTCFNVYATPELRDHDGEFIAAVGNGGPRAVANARRLAASWNACENVSTHDLEAIQRDSDLSWVGTIDRLVRERKALNERLESGKEVWRQDQQRIAELMAQRDELLELLSDVAQCFTRDDDLPDGLLGRIDSAISKHQHQAGTGPAQAS